MEGRKGISVLLVDDEKEFIETLAERLFNRGFDVDCVFSGKETLERLRDRSYNAIILDLLMPDMSGVEVFKHALTINASIPIIMLTGHADVKTAMEAMKAGLFDYMVKPVNIDELISKIEMADRYCRILDDHH